MFTFEDIAVQAGKKVRVEGFVATTRMQSKMAFVILQSGASKVQVVASGAAREQAKALMQQAYAAVEGSVVASAQAPGGFEIQAESVELVSPTIQWPISSDSEIGVKLAWPAARFRERKEALALIVQSEIEMEMTSYLRRLGFIGIHSPKLMGAPSESGSEVFEVKYFGERAYLAQSPQIYKQIAIMAGLGKIYEVGPVFRAEPSFSSRHATEFISFDVELEGVKTETEIIELECAMIIAALQQVIIRMGPELALHYPKATVPAACHVLEFAQAQALLGVSGDESLSAEEERQLGAMMQEQGHELVALTRVPWKQRPFYHMREGESLTRSFELLYRGVEITTGAIREHRYDVLMAQLAEKGLTGKGLEFYLESFKLAAPPHGGFGLGLARLTALFLGLPGIKEATFIHRGPGRLSP
ncbi:amino acid--tRNA ligase-related protein [Undibacterium sp. Ji42W]|uniref:amino acid--tRNA ligase-related protein n=1 Tax=Undibacterium sp. Ji42W TaxID=3413039 RepID=UPI003BF08B85